MNAEPRSRVAPAFLVPLAAMWVAVGLVTGQAAPASSRAVVIIRGHAQSVHLYGARGGHPAIVLSGDGGWIHVGPWVAQHMADAGYFVIGIDTRAYLSSFTDISTLHQEDVPGDVGAWLSYAAAGGRERPVLVGVSEGAGLSLLAATSPDIKARACGVIAIGLPSVSELGWRWRDALIYLTHGVPNEPSVATADTITHIAPLPLAVIHSTHDEYTPLAEVMRLMAHAQPPSQLWTVEATDHRFSDNLSTLASRLAEALAWMPRTGE